MKITKKKEKTFNCGLCNRQVKLGAFKHIKEHEKKYHDLPQWIYKSLEIIMKKYRENSYK